MRYKPIFNNEETTVETMQSIPKECTYLDLLGIVFETNDHRFDNYEDRRRFVEEVAETLPFISTSIQTLNLSSNVPFKIRQPDFHLICLLMIKIPPWINCLILRDNDFGQEHISHIMNLSVLSPKITLDTLDLRENELHDGNHTYYGNKQINTSNKIKLSFNVKTIIISSEEVIRMSKPKLEYLAKILPWGCEVKAMDANDNLFSSNKIGNPPIFN